MYYETYLGITPAEVMELGCRELCAERVTEMDAPESQIQNLQNICRALAMAKWQAEPIAEFVAELFSDLAQHCLEYSLTDEYFCNFMVHVWLEIRATASYWLYYYYGLGRINHMSMMEVLFMASIRCSCDANTTLSHPSSGLVLRSEDFGIPASN